jgi:hypothetical protein
MTIRRIDGCVSGPYDARSHGANKNITSAARQSWHARKLDDESRSHRARRALLDAYARRLPPEPLRAHQRKMLSYRISPPKMS